MLSAFASLTLMMSAIYESFNPARLGMVLICLILLHLLMQPWLRVYRELWLYAAFVSYMFLSLLWAPDALTAMNTLLPAINCLLVLILIGALVACHERRAVLAGILVGFLAGAVAYTRMAGFPFTFPEDFSYNAVAAMYLFGLFVTVAFGWLTRSRVLPLAIGLVLLIHIAATTSIKTNVGILLGVGAATLMYFKDSMRTLRRIAIPLVVVAAVTAYAVVSNDAVIERVQAGLERVSLGIGILQAREDVSASTSFADREYWRGEGLRGWASSPLFGNGVEAFRVNYGTTSHSTPIDLLYNTGLIGLCLFYGLFISIAWRLFRVREARHGSLEALILAGLVCYLFISLSATMHYHAFLAAFIAISVAFLRPPDVLVADPEISSADKAS